MPDTRLLLQSATSSYLVRPAGERIYTMWVVFHQVVGAAEAPIKPSRMRRVVRVGE
jgi:hypothetical protein